MPATTWNPADTSVATLSGGNLTVTGGVSAGGSRSIFSATSGKYYWEYTCTSFPNPMAVGIANASAVLTSVASTGTNAAIHVATGGQVLVNGSNSGFSLPVVPNGTICCYALDVGAQLFWIRVGPTGSWNATSGSANNPATGTGGISVSALGSTLYALFCSNSTGVVTANFAGPFAGVVPIAFTPGLGTGLTQMQATQLALEQWSMPNANAQLTQVGLEIWGAVTAVNTQMIATQLGLEMWASAALAGAGGRATVMIMA